mgnify:CR=1 FL=1
MLRNDTHAHYVDHINKFTTYAFELNKGKWQGEFIDGQLFLLRYTHGILFASICDTYYDLDYSVKAIGHDDKSRSQIPLIEIFDYLHWEYSIEDIWYT